METNMARRGTRKRRGVYQIKNTVTGMIYVGSSEDLAERWNKHKWRLRKGTHAATRMQEDFNAHGPNSFTYEILQEATGEEDIFDLEQRWLDELKPYDLGIGYNTHISSEDGRGVQRSEETRRRISMGHLGIKFSEEHKDKIAIANTGKEFSLERCQAISEAKKNSARTKAAMAALNATKRVLTDDDVRRIRSLGTGATAIAREFGVSRRVIRAILGGETYQHVS
jgi:group I intron endonuclease